MKTSLFKLWAKQEGKDPILMGVTTSWAGMFYSVPVDLKGQGKVKFGCICSISRYEEREPYRLG